MPALQWIFGIVPYEAVDQHPHRGEGHQEDCQAAGSHGIETALFEYHQGKGQHKNNKRNTEITPLLGIHDFPWISKERNRTQRLYLVAALYIAVPMPHPNPKENPNAAPMIP